jgi:hypothetical protein
MCFILYVNTVWELFAKTCTEELNCTKGACSVFVQRNCDSLGTKLNFSHWNFAEEKNDVRSEVFSQIHTLFMCRLIKFYTMDFFCSMQHKI